MESLIPSNGDFMPPEFWFAMTVLFGTAFVSLLIWIIRRFLDRMEVTIGWLKENVIRHDKRLDQGDRRHDEHDKQFDRIYKILEKTVKKQ